MSGRRCQEEQEQSAPTMHAASPLRNQGDIESGWLSLRPATCHLLLRFQVRNNPVFQPPPALVGGIKANAYALVRFLPGDIATHPDAGQRQ